MRDPGRIYDAYHASLTQCLLTVSEYCPELPTNTPPLHRMRNLIQVLLSIEPAEGWPTVDSLTVGQAIAMLSTAQEMLSSLIEAGPEAETKAGTHTGTESSSLAGTSGRIDEELRQALSETIADLHHRLGVTLRANQAHRVRGLYVIIDPVVTNGRDPLEVAKAAINGGAKMLQLRDKLRDKGEVLPLATELQKLCLANDADLIINDHADLALAVGSAGLHVGQTDLPVSQARAVLSSRQVIGRSNHEMEELTESQEMGADHLAFGAIYATGTKGVGRPPQGTERLRQARGLTKLPIVAIGGITAENVAPVIQAGADAICVAAAIGLAHDPEAAAAGLVAAIRNAGGKV